MTRRSRLTPRSPSSPRRLGGDSVTTAGQKVLEALTARTGLTSGLALLDDGFVVALLRVNGPGPVQLSTCSDAASCRMLRRRRGDLPTLPADDRHHRAPDRTPRHTPGAITNAAALKQQLKVIRQRGYSFDDEEDHDGMFCVGAAFYDRANVPSGAISVSSLKYGRGEAEFIASAKWCRACGATVERLGASVAADLSLRRAAPT